MIKKISKLKLATYIFAVIIIALGGLGIYKLVLKAHSVKSFSGSNNSTKIYSQKSQTTNNGSGQTSQNSSSGGTNLQSKSSTQSNSQSTTGTSTTAPASPFGNFVSNYSPNLSGSPSPNLIQSTCNTTPGASCVISFSMNGVTKSLSPETTDSNGAASWTWHLQDLGLTVGYWNITATATLNGQSISTGDTLKLDVQQ